MRKMLIFLFLTLFHLSICHAETTSKNMFAPNQFASLKSTGRQIIVPRYLPKGFKVKEVKVEKSSPSYSILFMGPENTCFIVEMASELGDLIVTDEKENDVKPTSTISNSVLGKASFWNTRYYLGTNWFPSGHKISGDIDRTDFTGDKQIIRQCSKRMPGAEFLKVAQSLVVLKN